MVEASANVGVITSTHPSSFKLQGTDCSGYPTFTFNYFNGPVNCSSEGFLDRNIDSQTGFMSLLHSSIVGAADGAAGAGSIKSFVKGPFSGKPLRPKHIPRTSTPLFLRSSLSSQCAPHRRLIRGLSSGCQGSAIKPFLGPTACVAGEFRAALDTFFETLSETQCWFVTWMNSNGS